MPSTNCHGAYWLTAVMRVDRQHTTKLDMPEPTANNQDSVAKNDLPTRKWSCPWLQKLTSAIRTLRYFYREPLTGLLQETDTWSSHVISTAECLRVLYGASEGHPTWASRWVPRIDVLSNTSPLRPNVLTKPTALTADTWRAWDAAHRASRTFHKTTAWSPGPTAGLQEGSHENPENPWLLQKPFNF